MNYVTLRTCLAVLCGLVLTATGLWASPAGEQEPAAAMEKEMVRDPATGKMVSAPEYGGTLTFSQRTPPGYHLMLTPISATCLQHLSPAPPQRSWESWTGQ